MRIHQILVFLAVPVAAVGQAPAPSNKPIPRQATSASDDLAKKIDVLSERVAQLEKEVGDFVNLVVSMQPTKDLDLDPSSLNKYSRLDLENGFVLVSLESATPYLDGIQATIKIGNPLYVTYKGFKIKSQWGKRYDHSKFTVETYEQWHRSLHSKEESFTDSLVPGSWTPVQLLLPDTEASDFGYLNITITTDILSLKR